MITSAKTSLNQIAAGLKKIVKYGYAKKGDKVLDYGGGKYDKGVEYLLDQGILGLVYDPYNRSEPHNKAALNLLYSGYFDLITVNNVLNVQQDLEEFMRGLCGNHITGDVKTVIFTVYAGDGSGVGRETRNGWQRNQKIDFYLDSLRKFYGDFATITKERGMIIARMNK